MDDMELLTNTSTATTTTEMQDLRPPVKTAAIGVLIFLLLVSFIVIVILIRMLLKTRKMRGLLKSNKHSENQSLSSGHRNCTYGSHYDKELQASDSLLSNPAYGTNNRSKVHDSKSISEDHYYSSVKDLDQHREQVYKSISGEHYYSCVKDLEQHREQVYIADPSSVVSSNSSIPVCTNDAYGHVRGKISGSVSINSSNNESAYDYARLPNEYIDVQVPGPRE